MTADASSSRQDATLGPKLSRRWHYARDPAISYLMQQAVENPHVISLAAGLVDAATLPVERVEAAVHSLLSDAQAGRTALQYGTTAGDLGFREQLVEHIRRLENGSPAGEQLNADSIVVTNGSQQLLSLVCEVLLDPGDICLVAGPTYFVFIGALEGVGAEAVTVAADEDGMQMSALEEALQQLDRDGRLERLKLIYLVSYFENPSGVSLSESRRAEAIEIAQRWSRFHKIYVLEDAAYRELRYDGPDLPSLWSYDPSRVILAQTFSKSFSPGLRLGYGVLPEELVEPVCDRKGNEDFGSSNFNQSLLRTVLQQNRYIEHVESLQAAYRIKRDTMLAAADEHFDALDGVSWFRPHGGLYVWMTLPASVPTGFDSRLFAHATGEEEVMYVPGELCYAGPVDERPHNQMRLSFGVQDSAGIWEGMLRLSRSVRAVL